MKILSEIITSLENKLQTAEGLQQIEIYLLLAEHLELVSSKMQQFYLQKIVDSPLLLPTSPQKIHAEILMAALVMNQMKAEDALVLINIALEKATLLDNSTLIIQAKIQKAIILQYNGMPNEALLTIHECVSASITIADMELIRASKTYAALIYIDKDLAASGQFAMDALALAKQTEKLWLVGYAHAILGYWAMENKVSEDSFYHFTEAEKYLRKQGAEEYLANVLGELSVNKKLKNNFETAFKYLQEAFIISKKVENIRLQVINANSLGRLHRAQKDYSKAENFYHEALLLATTNGVEYEQAAANVFLGNLYRDTEQYEKSILHFENARVVFGDKIRPSTKADLAKQLHGIYYKVNDIQKAYTTLLEYVEIRLKLQDENRIKETAQLQAKYEAEKREAELKEARLLQTESELKALKSQMNPHFIFNALNSIQEIFFLGDKRLANKHLSRFSQLMRNILKASGKKTITLHEEITMLQEYLTLEGLRFGTTFSFEILVDENVDTYTLDVPPMIIQPFVENAVKHGLLHKEGEQKIKLHFNFNEDTNVIIVTISDNGIGRKASALINKQRQQHDSFSTSATEKRFEILNQNLDTKFSFSFIDVEDEAGISKGTVVKIVLPI